MRCSLKTFGGASLAGDTGPLTGPAAQRHRLALLVLLAGHPRGLSRDKLLGYLWPERDTEHARNLLKQAVHALRRALGEGAILSVGEELWLDAAMLCCDLIELERALAAGEPAQAVELYTGPFLDGFFVSAAPELERWIDGERRRLADAYGRALEALAEASERQGDFSRAGEWWKRRAAHDPCDSRVALRLMQALEAGGNRAGALQHAAVHARLLQEELGIASAPEVEALAQRLRSERPSIGQQAQVAPPPTPSELPPPSRPPRELPPPSRPPRARYRVSAVAVLALGASSFWMMRRESDARWLRKDALPQIEAYLNVADWEGAYALARRAEARVPESPELAELWPRITWRVTIPSEPAGATVFRQAYMGPADQWEELGRTPLQDIRVPYGLSRLRFELPGHRPMVRALGGAHINWRQLTAGDPDLLLVGPEAYRLDPPAALPADMVRVPGGTVAVDGDSLQVQDFFIARHEVTNAEFKRFIDAGGYRRPDLWDPIEVNGVTLPWDRAMARFVDRTGRPGPSTWEASDYPKGQDGFPVAGVSWYEAAAYARFAGRELPTAHHWQLALANSMFPWLLPVSNFSDAGPRAVEESRAMSHVGAFDLAGNVREWTSTAVGRERIVLGGSWNDPYYIAGTGETSAPPEDRSAGNGIRLVVTQDEPAVTARLRTPVRSRSIVAPAGEQPPVTDAVYGAYGRSFAYDPEPLDARVEEVDTTRIWIRERVSFDAGYGTERVVLHLYLPAAGSPPYQTVVYWPGWDTFWLDDVDEYFAKQVDFIVKSGRAVAFPVYQGTFERRISDVRRRPKFGTAEYRDNAIHTVKELRRTVDYLETRSDIDAGALAYFGYSWGGVNGPVAMAQEPRLRVGVIAIGLLPPMAATPEVDPVNALPRVRAPVLMFSGEFDPMVPRENWERYFGLLGTPASQKRHVVAIGGHFIPRHLLIRETLDWLDRYLGRVER